MTIRKSIPKKVNVDANEHNALNFIVTVLEMEKHVGKAVNAQIVITL